MVRLLRKRLDAPDEVRSFTNGQALAGPSEVLVSATTYELLAGSSLAFEDRGLDELRGITGTRQIYALARAPDA